MRRSFTVFLLLLATFPVVVAQQPTSLTIQQLRAQSTSAAVIVYLPGRLPGIAAAELDPSIVLEQMDDGRLVLRASAPPPQQQRIYGEPFDIEAGDTQELFLLKKPRPGTIAVFRNGLRLRQGADYLVQTGGTIQFLPAAVPQAGDSILVDYDPE